MNYGLVTIGSCVVVVATISARDTASTDVGSSLGAYIILYSEILRMLQSYAVGCLDPVGASGRLQNHRVFEHLVQLVTLLEHHCVVKFAHHHFCKDIKKKGNSLPPEEAGLDWAAKSGSSNSPIEFCYFIRNKN